MTIDEKLARVFGDSFMRPFIFFGLWWRVEDKHGEGSSAPWNTYGHAELAHMLSEGSSIALERGYGARLSAPGYLDCTEWVVFATEDEAAQYLIDTYGDDVESEESDAQG